MSLLPVNECPAYDPERAQALRKEGNDEFHRHEYGKAIDCYRESMKHDASLRSVCLSNMEAAFFELGRYEECADTCRELIEELRTVDSQQLTADLQSLNQKAHMRLEKAEQSIQVRKVIAELRKNGQDFGTFVLRSCIRQRPLFRPVSTEHPMFLLSNLAPRLLGGTETKEVNVSILLDGFSDLRHLLATCVECCALPARSSVNFTLCHDTIYGLSRNVLFLCTIHDHSQKFIADDVSVCDSDSHPAWLELSRYIACMWLGLALYPPVYKFFKAQLATVIARSQSVAEFVRHYPFLRWSTTGPQGNQVMQKMRSEWERWNAIEEPASTIVIYLRLKDEPSLGILPSVLPSDLQRREWETEMEYYARTGLRLPHPSFGTDSADPSTWMSNPMFFEDDSWASAIGMHGVEPSSSWAELNSRTPVRPPCPGAVVLDVSNPSSIAPPFPSSTVEDADVFALVPFVYALSALVDERHQHSPLQTVTVCPTSQPCVPDLTVFGLQQGRSNNTPSTVEQEKISSTVYVSLYLGSYVEYCASAERKQVDYAVLFGLADADHMLTTMLASSRADCETVLLPLSYGRLLFLAREDQHDPMNAPDNSPDEQPHEQSIDPAKVTLHFFRSRPADIDRALGWVEQYLPSLAARTTSVCWHRMHQTVKLSTEEVQEWLLNMLCECLLPPERTANRQASFVEELSRFPSPVNACTFIALCHELVWLGLSPHVVTEFLLGVLGGRKILCRTTIAPVSLSLSDDNRSVLQKGCAATEVVDSCFLTQDILVAASLSKTPLISPEMQETDVCEFSTDDSQLPKFQIQFASVLPHMRCIGAIVACYHVDDYAGVSGRENYVKLLQRSRGRNQLISSVHLASNGSIRLFMSERLFAKLVEQSAHVVLIRVDSWESISEPVPLRTFGCCVR